MFHVSVMVFLVLAANNNVVKGREARHKIILICKLHHLSLKTGNSVTDPERQTGELIEIASSFKCCVRLVFIVELHLMICTSKICTILCIRVFSADKHFALIVSLRE